MSFMARQAYPPHSEQESRLNVFIPSELHRNLKATLAIEGKTLRQWLIEAATAKVKRNQTRKGRGRA